MCSFSPPYLCSVNIHQALQLWRNSFSTRALPLFDEQPLIHTWREDDGFANTFTQGYSHLSCLKFRNPKNNSRCTNAHLHVGAIWRKCLFLFRRLTENCSLNTFSYGAIRKCIHRVRSSGSAGFHFLQASQDTEHGRLILFDSDLSGLFFFLFFFKVDL